jgi:hypothetical protein
MNRAIKDVPPSATDSTASERPLTLTTMSGPSPCAVLLRSFTEGGPVPDDFEGLPKTAEALKSHVRSDGAVYLGAFEVQGDKDSVVLMYGPSNLTETRAEAIANMERLALTNRHAAWALGPFARQQTGPAQSGVRPRAPKGAA